MNVVAVILLCTLQARPRFNNSR